MGRRKIYLTDEEKKASRRAISRRHRLKIRKKLEEYEDLKRKLNKMASA